MQGNNFKKASIAFLFGALTVASMSAQAQGAWVPGLGLNTQNPADLSITPHYELILQPIVVMPHTTTNVTINGVPASGTANSTVALPFFRLAYRLNAKWVVGLDYNHPGLAVAFNYGPYTTLSVLANNTALHTENVNPRVSYQLNKNVAVGVGADIERTWATLSTGGGVTPLFTIANGEGWGVGWDAGVFVTVTPRTFLSLSGFSQVRTTLRGFSNIGPISSNNTSLLLYQPTTFALRLTQILSPKWLVQFMGTWSENAVNKEMDFQNTAVGRILLPLWNNNSFMVQMYGHYAFNSTWGLGFAGSFAEGVAPQIANTVNFPIGDWYVAFIGPDVKLNKTATLQLGFAHVWQDVNLNYLAAPGVRVIGNSRLGVNVIDLKLTFKG